MAFLENPGPGVYSLPIAQFFNFSNPTAPFDFTTVTAAAMTVAFEESFNGRVRIGPVTTSGPIGDGPDVDPPDDPPEDDDLRPLLSGTYYNAARDGEGCQVTVEGDGLTIVLSCYLFQGGGQAWVIGVGQLVDGTVVFDLTLTEGADFGSGFDPADVVRVPFGTGTMSWSSCNEATLALDSGVEGFDPITLELAKFVANNCSAEPPDDMRHHGTLYNPGRDGEGFQLTVLGDTGIQVMTWYTYLDGRQAWLIGTGIRQGDRVVFDDMVITEGADYGAAFDPADVVRTPWGTITLDYSDCNTAMATVAPLAELPGFDGFEVEVSKLVPGECPAAVAPESK